MSLKTKVLIWLGAIGAAFTTAQLALVIGFDRDWAPVIGLSAMFAFMAFGFDSARWAALSVPGFVAMIVGINYLRLHPSPAGVGMLGLALALNLLLLWAKRRGRPGPSHA